MNRLLPRVLAWCIAACLLAQNPASAARATCAHQVAHPLLSNDSTPTQHRGHAHDGHAMHASSADQHELPTRVGCDCGCDCNQPCASPSTPAAHHAPTLMRIDSADRLRAATIILGAPQVPLPPLLRPPIDV